MNRLLAATFVLYFAVAGCTKDDAGARETPAGLLDYATGAATPAGRPRKPTGEFTALTFDREGRLVFAIEVNKPGFGGQLIHQGGPPGGDSGAFRSRGQHRDPGHSPGRHRRG
ncbi:hypothetical protein [Kribbella sp. CA-294648]|uniref:hypothetical protein n=1 Tax=Kribbella sp. CA-294648 TaxID=3239948 RepID=UPI003D8A772B